MVTSSDSMCRLYCWSLHGPLCPMSCTLCRWGHHTMPLGSSWFTLWYLSGTASVCSIFLKYTDVWCSMSVCLSVQVVASVNIGAASVCPPQLFQSRGTAWGVCVRMCACTCVRVCVCSTFHFLLLTSSYYCTLKRNYCVSLFPLSRFTSAALPSFPCWLWIKVRSHVTWLAPPDKMTLTVVFYSVLRPLESAPCH